MTSEQFEAVKTAAFEMISEIEMAEFPEDCLPLRTIASVWANFDDTQAALRVTLHKMFSLLEPDRESLLSHREPALEAAGMIGSAFKFVFKQWAASHGNPPPEGPVRLKFKRFDVFFTQAPPNVHVPSMRGQIQGEAPRFGGKEGPTWPLN